LKVLIRERGDELVRMDQSLFPCPEGDLQGDIEIHDRKLVLDERATGATVVAAPLDIGEFNAVAFDQEAGAAVGERVGHRRGPGRIEVELGARAVNVAMMEKPLEAPIHGIHRTANKRGDVGGSQEAMACQVAHNC
jgi:hypothetical protein